MVGTKLTPKILPKPNSEKQWYLVFYKPATEKTTTETLIECGINGFCSLKYPNET